jgi:K+-transporting ATPase ATPase C chain
MKTLTGYLRQTGTALRFLIFATLVLGLAYPLFIFGAGQLIAPYQANGSILKDDGGAPAASALIAQSSADDAGAQDPALQLLGVEVYVSAADAPLARQLIAGRE